MTWEQFDDYIWDIRVFCIFSSEQIIMHGMLDKLNQVSFNEIKTSLYEFNNDYTLITKAIRVSALYEEELRQAITTPQ